ncbi:phosphoglycolate phosphatase [Ruegeria sp. Ofav3-42]|uniref:phosphoglycolate phosphatase n=1 Tax=Ruegeria sp. Ofav3-42 TaxID=2917759 RepID=UPI001EF53AA8|nr:phosphoglycolate phosphatase [Ruegeria sp. Ofav3-42]MCG7520947.1 phosphoglycolate phosphatase [Ruegeria sp. Ofav3-42]
MTATIMFDLDGTLVDSLPDIAAAANRTLLDIGISPLPEKTIKQFVGNGLPKLVERMIRHHDLPIERHGELTKLTLAHYSAASSDKTIPYPGVPKALTQLREMGCVLGVCTNKPEAPARHVLEALDLSHHFDAVFGGDTLATRKPDPAHLEASFHAVTPSGPRLFVGDSEVDAETAQRANVPFLLFSEGYRKTAVTEIPHMFSYDDTRKLPALVIKAVQRLETES